MHATARHGKQVFNEINITPLTDIFLVLLIIMMVVAPMMQQVRPEIKPPKVANGAPVEQNRLTVEIVAGGAMYLQGKPVSDADLTETLKTEEAHLLAKTGGDKAASGTSGEGREKNLIIRADKDTRSGQVLKVFDAARDAGFTKVTVAGEALGQERENALKPRSTTEQSGETQ